MTRFTLSQAERLLADGKIRGLKVSKPSKKKGQPATPKPSKEKAWIGWNVKVWCEERGLDLKTEYQFHQDRMFRFDWAIPLILVGVEYEGLMSEKSGHTTVDGYTKDTEKYNLAQSMGYVVLRYTARNYKNVVNDLNKLWTSKAK